jgi:peroxisomal 2,4-dienoyl-CoA reductase
VALITGGGSGIGFEISTQFGKHGASIAIMGRRKQILDSAVSALHSLGIPVLSSILPSNFFLFLKFSSGFF